MRRSLLRRLNRSFADHRRTGRDFSPPTLIGVSNGEEKSQEKREEKEVVS
jgi:hypothetical protein